jgi:hypothetical protein
MSTDEEMRIYEMDPSIRNAIRSMRERGESAAEITLKGPLQPENHFHEWSATNEGK